MYSSAGFFAGMVVGQLRRDDAPGSPAGSAFDVLAADAQEVVVGDAVVEVDLALVAALDERASRGSAAGVPDAPITTASGFAAMSFSDLAGDARVGAERSARSRRS